MKRLSVLLMILSLGLFGLGCGGQDTGGDGVDTTPPAGENGGMDVMNGGDDAAGGDDADGGAAAPNGGEAPGGGDAAPAGGGEEDDAPAAP